jgi:hypothetical protein
MRRGLRRMLHGPRPAAVARQPKAGPGRRAGKLWPIPRPIPPPRPSPLRRVISRALHQGRPHEVSSAVARRTFPPSPPSRPLPAPDAPGHAPGRVCVKTSRQSAPRAPELTGHGSAAALRSALVARGVAPGVEHLGDGADAPRPGAIRRCRFRARGRRWCGHTVVIAGSRITTRNRAVPPPHRRPARSTLATSMAFSPGQIIPPAHRPRSPVWARSPYWLVSGGPEKNLRWRELPRVRSTSFSSSAGAGRSRQGLRPANPALRS